MKISEDISEDICGFVSISDQWEFQDPTDGGT